MSSDLQRDIEAVERVLMQAFRLDSDVDAWLRLKVRLTPDRERVIEAVRGTGYVTHRQAQEVADAAIKAMEGNDDHA